NADGYQRVYVAARLVVVALSIVLGVLVWRFARRLYGARAGLLALAFYVFAPEALAHAGVFSMDLATALGWVATLYAFWLFVRSGRWGWWWATAAAFGLTLLVRFSALGLVPGPAHSTGYLLGQIYTGSRWYYYPLAFLFKWPLAFLGALALRGVTAVGPWRRGARVRGDVLVVAIAIYLGAGMFAGFNVGIRY